MTKRCQPSLTIDDSITRFSSLGPKQGTHRLISLNFRSSTSFGVLDDGVALPGEDDHRSNDRIHAKVRVLDNPLPAEVRTEGTADMELTIAVALPPVRVRSAVDVASTTIVDQPACYHPHALRPNRDCGAAFCDGQALCTEDQQLGAWAKRTSSDGGTANNSRARLTRLR